MENENKALTESIEKLSTKVSRLASFGRSFLQGIFFGLGSVIGASIVAAILFGALNWFLHSVNSVPGLKNIETIRLQK